MPLYEFLCPMHGVFEEIHSFKYRPKVSKCPCFDDNFEDCKEVCPIQVSLPTMKPDRSWAGVVTPTGKYVTSDKEYEREAGHLVPATRELKEYTQKKHAQVGREREEKKADKLDRFLGNQLRDFDMPGGNDAEASATAFVDRMRRE